MKANLNYHLGHWSGVFAAAMGLVGVLILSQTVQAQTPTEPPEEKTLLPAHVFVPPGFDDNDDSQIVIAGHLPNTCYRATSPVVEKRKDGSVLIKNSAYFWTGCFCLEVLVPYQHVVELKMLKQGNHKIFALDGLGREVEIGNLPVAQAAKKEPDDQLYAPVVEVATVKNLDGTFNLKLSGEFQLSCMRLVEPQTVLKRVPNVIEVLPGAEKDESVKCEAGRFHFETSVPIGKIGENPTLIHIRTMNGQAINKVLGL